MPSTNPATEASSPSTAASTSVERTTWRRDAPTARSSAVSRRRCEISMVKVLATMNAPTNSAMPAKTISDLVSDRVLRVISSAWIRASSVPLCAEAPSSGSIR